MTLLLAPLSAQNLAYASKGLPFLAACQGSNQPRIFLFFCGCLWVCLVCHGWSVLLPCVAVRNLGASGLSATPGLLEST